MAPVVGFFAVFNLFPVMFGFAISLTDYDLLDPPNFVGLDNFRNLLDDELFVAPLPAPVEVAELPVVAEALAEGMESLVEWVGKASTPATPAMVPPRTS